MRALVLTYHIKDSKRVGGFHRFITYLQERACDIDWVPLTVSSSWVFQRNDRENARNFFKLCHGESVEEGGSCLRYFTVPVFVPARLSAKIGKDLTGCYWPDWKRLRKRLANSYDLILVEGVGCQYGPMLREAYPTAKIIYRPSDILKSFSSASNPENLETEMIEASDATCCVDENQLNYYLSIGADPLRLSILRNPLCSADAKNRLMDFRLPQNGRKSVVYLGTSFVDLDLIEKAAERFSAVEFIVIGPFDRKSRGNLRYTGSLTQKEYAPILEQASVGVSPISRQMHEDSGVIFGYTRKIIQYMQYLLPIVATYSSNYMNVQGFYTAFSEEEFLETLGRVLDFELDDRESLRSGYLRVMDEFSEEKVRMQFLNLTS